MNIKLIYFSQTGNTRTVANAMGDALLAKGHLVKVNSFKEMSPKEVSACDLLGIGTPCYSSQAPTPIKTFLYALPTLIDQQAFVFATASGAPGKVLYDLTRILEQKGAHVLGGFIARGEVHHPAPHMNAQFPNRPNVADLLLARQFALTIVDRKLNRSDRNLSQSYTDSIKQRWGFYELLGLISTDRILRLLMPEPKLIHGKCDQCHLCACQCPLDNIILNPYPRLGDRCIRCYHCLTICPQQAFEADWRFGDPFLQLLYNRHFMRWFGDLKAGESIY